MGRQPRIGDVFEIPVSNGLAYGQYVAFDSTPPVFGYFVRVFRGTFQERPAELKAILRLPVQFSTFFPLGSAFARKLVSFVGNEKPPERFAKLPLLKAAAAWHLDKPGVKNWSVQDKNGVWAVRKLTAAERRYPIRQLMNFKALTDSIEQGWTASTPVLREHLASHKSRRPQANRPVSSSPARAASGKTAEMRAILDDFAIKLISVVRDRPCWTLQREISGELRGATSDAFHEQYLALDPKAKDFVHRYLMRAVNGCVACSLGFLENNSLKILYTTDEGVEVDIKLLSGGFIERLYGKKGWIARFSEYTDRIEPLA